MQILEKRINAIFAALDAAYSGGSESSSATKGNEREQFVNAILRNAFPPHYRFSSGDIIDSYGSQSGQVDVVLEQPRSYSFPLLAGGPRLYLAESVAAVIEVKSNLSNQWDEVEKTADKLATIRRRFSSTSYQEMLSQIESGSVEIEEGADMKTIKDALKRQADLLENIGEERIRLFVIGFSGWSKNSTMVSKLTDNKIDGILQIDRKVFCTKIDRSLGVEAVEGYKSLLNLLHLLEIYFEKVPNRLTPLMLY